MNSEDTIIDYEWDHQIVKDASTGKRKKLIRGIDYDLTWKKIGGPFAKNHKAIFRFLYTEYEKFYKIIDIQSFELIAEGKSIYYFKDKNNVYIDSYRNSFSLIHEANPNDFKIIDLENGYSNSRETDYFFDQKIPFRLKDSKIFEGELYQKVGDDIYFAFEKKMDCDADSFQLVDSREWHKTVYKDKNHIYHRGKIVDDADPNTFHFLENCINESKRPNYVDSDIHYYAKDKNFAYFIDGGFRIKKIKTKDVEGFDFKVIDSIGFAFDKDYTYLNGVRKKNN